MVEAPAWSGHLKVAPGVVAAEDWDEAVLAAASRTFALEAVDNLAQQYDCAASYEPVIRRGRFGEGTTRPACLHRGGPRAAPRGPCPSPQSPESAVLAHARSGHRPERGGGQVP
ncbi:hypothetical protein OG413_38910 [Streptomyces sp. NBC_01433]|uniref:hypothetical protein n=1 Tax=Streptomyces sp. NBC_01433 TaxID=2903864 RepID=UPI002255F5E8|nr:hypothetical protein [Streptomyces sp. NBC_01433]MCX4681176.1 hypothetical protein [Streptomyces sp. NBC_01433]